MVTGRPETRVAVTLTTGDPDTADTQEVVASAGVRVLGKPLTIEPVRQILAEVVRAGSGRSA